ncbi:hypothetical protein H1C71_015122 [Ictidomys tridecemlineatus]|nr:hypothetical protein H1C71_015122 [Ictidomys tridecemlineatus]
MDPPRPQTTARPHRPPLLPQPGRTPPSLSSSEAQSLGPKGSGFQGPQVTPVDMGASGLPHASLGSWDSSQSRGPGNTGSCSQWVGRQGCSLGHGLGRLPLALGAG